MPEAAAAKGRTMPAERSGGFFIARVVSPGAVAAAAPRPRRPRRLTPEENKENIAPLGSGRRRKSPLPVWYPRTPLRDVTTIVQVLEARRARRAQLRRLNAEASPDTLALVSPTIQPGEIPTEGLPSEVSDASPSSNPPAAITTPLPLKFELQACSPPAKETASTSNEASPAVPQRTPETHPMLCSKLNEIEKSAKAYMKRTPMKPAKKIIARRTLMSMR